MMPQTPGSNNVKLIRLLDDVVENRLKLRPVYQRRLVWNNEAKENFIDTILKGYPFPEIYIADGDRQKNSTKQVEELVDGQQRLTTAIDYYQGSNTLLYKTIRRYDDLSDAEQNSFLDYNVAVRNLGRRSLDEIREIFRRINSTDYALKSMEVLNAMYDGSYKNFCVKLSLDEFFSRHNVFPESYRKRMYDVTFCVILVTTMLSGYYKRDERNKEYLERYNDIFAESDEVQVAIDRAFDFVERCGFLPKSRAWKQTDLFTLLVEAGRATNEVPGLDAVTAGERVQAFFGQVDTMYDNKAVTDEADVPADSRKAFAYLKAATRATNDKYSRVVRADIILNLIRGVPVAEGPDSDPAIDSGDDEPKTPRLKPEAANKKQKKKSAAGKKAD